MIWAVQNRDLGGLKMTFSAWVMAKTMLIYNVNYTRRRPKTTYLQNRCLARTHADPVISDHQIEVGLGHRDPVLTTTPLTRTREIGPLPLRESTQLRSPDLR